MTVLQLYEALNARIPAALSCEWDNDGLMCCPDGRREVKKVLVTLDITERAVEKAIEEGFDVVLSHHPLIFRPIRALVEDQGVPRKLMRLVQHGVSAMSFHTRLDAVRGGVNDVLAGLFDLHGVAAFGPEGETMGRVGDLRAPMALSELAVLVKTVLGAPAVLVSGGGTVSRVALLGGNGDDFIESARANGADVLVSGRLGYHPMTDGAENGMALIEAGHYFTERPVLSVFVEMLGEIDPKIEAALFESLNICMI